MTLIVSGCGTASSQQSMRTVGNEQKTEATAQESVRDAKDAINVAVDFYKTRRPQVVLDPSRAKAYKGILENESVWVVTFKRPYMDVVLTIFVRDDRSAFVDFSVRPPLPSE